MDLKTLLAKKTFNEENKENKLSSWQDYAINICKDFDVDREFQQIIFRQAKRNISFLQGKVALCVEKFGEKGCRYKSRYLISLFRTKKPWEK